jgi:hypothetical protein
LNYHGVRKVVDGKVVLKSILAEARRDEHDACVAPIIQST